MFDGEILSPKCNVNEGCNDIDARSPLLLCCMTGTHDLISLAVAAELWIFPFQIRPTMNFSESDEKRKRRRRLIYLIISFAATPTTPDSLTSPRLSTRTTGDKFDWNIEISFQYGIGILLFRRLVLNMVLRFGVLTYVLTAAAPDRVLRSVFNTVLDMILRTGREGRVQQLGHVLSAWHPKFPSQYWIQYHIRYCNGIPLTKK